MNTQVAAYAPRLVSAPMPLQGWLNAFDGFEIPVLCDTAIELEEFRAQEDQIDANRLGDWIAHDPLMTLKVLVHEAAHRSQRVVTCAGTVTAAIVMTGISPFFRAFGPQPCVEELLRARPGAQTDFDSVMTRASRGADFALALAVRRTDPHAALIHAAALLHEFSELLVWCLAPDLASEVVRWQRNVPDQRSRAVQEAVLGVDLETLQRSLIAQWRLPPLLDEVTTQREQPSARTGARTVMLATRLARHAANGWDDPAIDDDLADIASFLNSSTEAAEELMKSV